MILTPKISNNNFNAFLWHAGFLALAQNFMDVDTVIPAMLIESGGGAIHIGIMTAIMMGGSSFTQLFFAPYISNKGFKKKFLLLGINSRIFALFALGGILFYLQAHQSKIILGLIFIFITLFSLGGAFSNICYTDILGKSVDENKRKLFFSAKQVIVGSVVLLSAFLAKRVLTAFGYPVNYSIMFFIGASLLLIASAGFWKIIEVSRSFMKINGFKQFLRILQQEWTQNKNLSYFLGFINTQGIMLSFLPFVMLYAKERLNTQSSDTGFFLLFKVIGVVTAGTLVFFFIKRLKYHPLLYLNVALSFTLILLTLFIKDEVALRYLFIMGGLVNSLYLITMNGLLLEVSGNENRALYAGFAGAGNILPAVFPLTGSWIIGQFGFRVFFILFMLIVLSAVWFIYKIDCDK
jgi:MFS family permease